MGDPGLQRITDIAKALRETILLTPRAKRPIGLLEFPLGSCGDTVLLLGTFLSQAGFGEFSYVSAGREDIEKKAWETHAWIEQDSLIIDITADQFPEKKNDAVIVTKESSWHDSFSNRRVRIANLDAFEGPSMRKLREYYKSIKQTVELLFQKENSVKIESPQYDDLKPLNPD